MPPTLNQVFFTNSGAEAVEGAVKLAKAATGRPAIIAFRGAFHGRTHLAMALTTSRVKVRGHYEPLVPSIYYAPYPYPFRNPYNVPADDVDLVCIAELERLFQTMVMPDDVAAIIVEPMLGEGGYVLPPKRFLQNLRAICDRYGILLIVDEIQTGVGRTGKMWAFEHFEIVPDIVTVAKGIASGLPLAAVVAPTVVGDPALPTSSGSVSRSFAPQTVRGQSSARAIRSGSRNLGWFTPTRTETTAGRGTATTSYPPPSSRRTLAFCTSGSSSTRDA
jgi:4-aminobutyrate aminotransferase